MSEHSAVVSWDRYTATFTDGRYSRAHRWTFDGGATIPASSSPHVVPIPMSDPLGVDPEEAFVAALSSCHMLFFLSYAARRGFVVDRYEDHAVGTMGKDEAGVLAMTRVVLRPVVVWAGEAQPSPEDLRALHHEAHASCFLANSVRFPVVVHEP
ncbi:peroxiredoxin [Luteitalea sp. TBR-22]|uniref:OsmC family protein n=1 Tax=Luteitalea sp. TBR-22 TaxID=2802971 RepID=UPI001AF52342|nr:OsmC family protein [Luteitalea sp. TBR-22]BCS31489.1 peroxiredoxin [Luteitalea sp. TBR-22]